MNSAKKRGRMRICHEVSTKHFRLECVGGVRGGDVIVLCGMAKLSLFKNINNSQIFI